MAHVCIWVFNVTTKRNCCLEPNHLYMKYWEMCEILWNVWNFEKFVKFCEFREILRNLRNLVKCVKFCEICEILRNLWKIFLKVHPLIWVENPSVNSRNLWLKGHINKARLLQLNNWRRWKRSKPEESDHEISAESGTVSQALFLSHLKHKIIRWME